MEFRVLLCLLHYLMVLHVLGIQPTPWNARAAPVHDQASTTPCLEEHHLHCDVSSVQIHAAVLFPHTMQPIVVDNQFAICPELGAVI